MLETHYSTISAIAIARAVDEHYAIGPVADCVLHARGFNDVYALTGADGRAYMARLCDHRFRGRANIDYETALLVHLAAAGISVGAPVAARDGRLWRDLAAPEGPREFAVFGRLEGRMAFAGVMRTGKADDQALADVAALGESLARIHTAGDSYAGPESRYRVEGPHLLVAPLAQIQGAPVIDADLSAGYAALGETLAARLTARQSALSVGLCHGDNHGGNALIADAPDGERIAGWFDFDEGGPGFLAYDLATFAWNFLSFARRTSLSDDTAPLWPAFIKGYRGSRAIPEADFEAIALFIAIRHVWFVGQYASRIPQWGVGFVSTDWMRDQLDLIRKWDGMVTPPVA